MKTLNLSEEEVESIIKSRKEEELRKQHKKNVSKEEELRKQHKKIVSSLTIKEKKQLLKNREELNKKEEISKKFFESRESIYLEDEKSRDAEVKRWRSTLLSKKVLDFLFYKDDNSLPNHWTIDW